MTEKDLKLIEEAKRITIPDYYYQIDELVKQAESDEAKEILGHMATSLYLKSEYEFI